MSKQKYFTEKERTIGYKKRYKKYYEKHKKEIITKKLAYQQNHQEETKLRKKIYRKNNKEKINEYNRKYEDFKKNTDIIFKLKRNLRSRLYVALKNNYKSGSAVQDLGCTIPELKLHLEAKFQPGMTWSNWSRTGWHIDHIIPLDNFNLQDREEFVKANKYTNLQPMWAEENIKKNNKVI